MMNRLRDELEMMTRGNILILVGRKLDLNNNHHQPNQDQDNNLEIKQEEEEEEEDEEGCKVDQDENWILLVKTTIKTSYHPLVDTFVYQRKRDPFG